MPLLKQTTLSKQCSNVYKMSLVRQSSSLAASLDPFRSITASCAPLQDEFQLSVGSGKPFGSMNMVSKVSALLSCWQLPPQPAASTCRACCFLCRCASRVCQSVCGSLQPVLLLQDEFLQTVWDREPSLLSLGDMEGELEPARRELRQLPSFNSAGSFSLPEDYRWGNPPQQRVGQTALGAAGHTAVRWDQAAGSWPCSASNCAAWNRLCSSPASGHPPRNAPQPLTDRAPGHAILDKSATSAVCCSGADLSCQSVTA